MLVSFPESIGRILAITISLYTVPPSRPAARLMARRNDQAGLLSGAVGALAASGSVHVAAVPRQHAGRDRRLDRLGVRCSSPRPTTQTRPERRRPGQGQSRCNRPARGWPAPEDTAQRKATPGGIHRESQRAQQANGKQPVRFVALPVQLRRQVHGERRLHQADKPEEAIGLPLKEQPVAHDACGQGRRDCRHAHQGHRGQEVATSGIMPPNGDGRDRHHRLRQHTSIHSPQPHCVGNR